MKKFRDIIPFIQDGTWEVDVSLNNLQLMLDTWEERDGLDLNPDFQRGHVWTESQQISFMEAFLRGLRTARVIYFNSPAFGLKNDGKPIDLSDEIVCVDGLQRLTAALRFLNNEIPVFGSYFSDFEDRPRETYSFKFNVNCLKTRKELLEWYLQFNSGGTVHSEEELNRVRKLLAECV